jgi:hypothetical protein
MSIKAPSQEGAFFVGRAEYVVRKGRSSEGGRLRWAGVYLCRFLLCAV